jgi:cell division protein FtsB
MEARERKKQPSKRKIFIIIFLVIVSFLMIDLNNRLIELFHLRDQHDQLELQVTEMVATKEYLITKQAYATSENAVEEWAREDGHMIQDGDYPIIPLAPAEAETVLEPFVFSTPTAVRNIDIWYELFFGD